MKFKIVYPILVSVSAVLLSACGESEVAEKAPLPGEKIVNANCKVCHAQGINGAPVLGNVNMWGPRITKGKEQLVKNAISGFGLMPAKGGKTELTDLEIDQAVTYMLSLVE